MGDSLGEALPNEMARVREVRDVYLLPEMNGKIAAGLMAADLDAAAKAMVEGDVVAMARAYEALKGWQL